MINDEIVEGYLDLIRESGVTISTTRLLRKFKDSKNRIDRGINMDSLINCGPAFIPIHHTSLSHWTFARLVPGRGDSVIAEHFDSLNIAPVTMLENWLEQRFVGIQTKIIQGRSPEQRNGTDCGLFMLMGIRMMAFGSQHLSQHEADEIMSTFRQRVLAEILAGTLDPTSSEYTEFIVQEEMAAHNVQPQGSCVEYEGAGDSTQPICLDTPEPSPPRIDDNCYPGVQTSPSDCSVSAPESCLLEVNGRDSPEVILSQSNKSDKDKANDELNHQARLLSLDMSCPVYSEMVSAKQIRASKAVKSSRPKERGHIEIVESFAHEQSMINMLRSAVMAYRTKKSVISGSETLASLWIGLACEENPQHTLIIRHRRERFSRMLFKEVERLGGSRTRVLPRVRVQMEAMLNCQGDQKTWKAAQAQAAKSSIWTELVECVMPFLGAQSSVAICAISQSTTAIESMTRKERDSFFQGIQCRLRDPRDQIIPTLLAASNLYRAITEDTLPNHTLTIERRVDLEMMSFTAIANLEEALPKLPLPS